MEDVRKVEPALTAEEWRDWLSGFSRWDGKPVVLLDHAWPENPHQIAAALLHGQPFGFDAWMVDWLYERIWGNVPEEIQATCREEQDVDALIAERIAALLPPR